MSFLKQIIDFTVTCIFWIFIWSKNLIIVAFLLLISLIQRFYLKFPFTYLFLEKIIGSIFLLISKFSISNIIYIYLFITFHFIKIIGYFLWYIYLTLLNPYWNSIFKTIAIYVLFFWFHDWFRTFFIQEMGILYTLNIFLVLPLLGRFYLFFKNQNLKNKYWYTPKIYFKELKITALYISSICFAFSLYILFLLNKTETLFQNYFIVKLIVPFFQNNLIFGVDYISMSLIILTNLFIYLCILSLRYAENYGKYSIYEILILLFYIQFGLICAFSVLDLLGFFIFFEATLIPIFLIILRGGSRARKSRAGYLIAIYTLFGSIFMLYNVTYILNKFGSTNYIYLLNILFSKDEQKILWITFFLTFAVKIPMFPLHLWLPEAHVEAPTIGSVILAALLLKLGIYGLIRFALILFPYGQEFFKHWIAAWAICSFFYTNFAAIRQVDIKKIVAYSSVVHMNLIVLGILCLSVESLDGAIYQMLAHGIVSGALFFCIGMLYERYNSRYLWYFGGIAFLFPLYSIFLFIFTLANISFPATSNFIGEMLLFIGILKDNVILGIFACFNMFFGAISNVWTYNRICFGNIKSYSLKPQIYYDIDKIDFVILGILIFILGLTGIYSSTILEFINVNTTFIIHKTLNSLIF